MRKFQDDHERCINKIDICVKLKEYILIANERKEDSCAQEDPVYPTKVLVMLIKLNQMLLSKGKLKYLLLYPYREKYTLYHAEERLIEKSMRKTKLSHWRSLAMVKDSEEGN